MLCSIAVSTADTWASEIGIRYGKKTIDIVRFRKVPVGLSGGISIAGTFGGLIGSFVTAVWAFILLSPDSVFAFLIIGTAGFAGMLVDSILGAVIQARYQDSSGQATDRKTAQRIGGLHWVSNDLVNLFSNGILVAIVYIWLS